MQLLAFGGCRDAAGGGAASGGRAREQRPVPGPDDPLGIAILTVADDPNQFVDVVRPLLAQEPFTALVPKPDYTMFGLTYAHRLRARSSRVAHRASAGTVPAWRWATRYPLAAKRPFLAVDAGRAAHHPRGTRRHRHDLRCRRFAHDVRLACHGLDRDDNDFVIGLIGKELFPLSAVVQAMRKTQQTSLYLDRLGPFFVGRALWQSPGNAE